MRQITANVRLFPEVQGHSPTVGYVTTSEGIVMIDTPQLPTDAAKWRNDIAGKGEVRYIINTHHHTDHIAGNYFFPGIIVSHEGVREMFSAPVERFMPFGLTDKEKEYSLVDFIRLRLEQRDPESAPLLEHYQLRAPTITFSERLNLYVGEHTFELIHMPGHTPSHIGVYIPREKVFFAGDNYTNGVQPSLAHCLPLEWVKSLKKIQAMDVDVVVAGHGEACGKKEDVREFTSFVQKCINMVRQAIKQGMSREEAADRISFKDLYAIHTGEGMQRINVLRLYDMLLK